MLILFTDSDTDITPKEAREYGYHMISMPYMIGDQTFYPYKDEDEFDFVAFYEMLAKGTMPKTSALSPGEYIEYFEPHFANGDDILYVHFSAAMSGTFQAMALALNELKEKYPERKFYEIDCKGITINAYYTVRQVGKMFKAGASLEEMLAYAEKEVDKTATYFYASDLKFFARSGRVSGFKAFMGGLIGIHPIINMSQAGVMDSVDKSRGRNQTLSKIVDYMVKLGDDVAGHEIVIGHSNAPKEVEILRNMIKEKFGENLNIVEVSVNPTAGSHCGPNNVGVAFHAIHR